METAIFLKAAADCAAFLALGGYVLGFFFKVSFMPFALIFPPLSVMLCFLLRDKKAPLKYLPLLLSLGAFPFCSSVGEAALTAALCVYCVYIAVKQIYLNDGDDYKNIFQGELICAVFTSIICAISFDFDKLNSVQLPYVPVVACCGIALLRILRHSREVIDSLSFRRSNLITLAAVIAAGALLSSETFISGVTHIASLIYNGVFVNLIMAVIYVVIKGASLLSGLFSMIFNKQVTFQSEGDDTAAGRPDFYFEDEGLAQVPQPLVYAAAVFAAVLAVYLAVKLFKQLAGRNRRFETNGGEISRESISLSRRSPFSLRFSSDREKVRQQYRKFLKECLARGMRILPSNDSLEIENGASELFPGAPLSKLRQVYIKARYTEKEITGDDLRHSKELYSAIKKVRPPEDEKGA